MGNYQEIFVTFNAIKFRCVCVCVFFFNLLSTGSGWHSDARREKHVLIFLHFLFPELFHSPALPGSPLIAYHVTKIVANNAPSLTVTNGTSVTLESGQNGIIVVELNDPDAGDNITLLPAPGNNRTSCLRISGNIVTVNTSDLMGCDIAWVCLK